MFVYIFLFCIVLFVVIILFLIYSSFSKKKNILALEKTILEISVDIQNLKTENTVLKKEKEILEISLKKQENDFKTLKESMKTEFQKISLELIEEQRNKFKEQSEESLHSLTKPLTENIKEFKEKIDKYDKEHSTRSQILEKEIKRHNETTQTLVNAFNKDKKMQGNWGERQLELILQQIGFRNGVEYKTQVVGKSEESDKNDQKPDVILYLPDEKSIIIDAKVSFSNFYAMHNTESETEQNVFKKTFINDVQEQIKNLSNKNYNNIIIDNEKLNTPEFTLMFMPHESAFSLLIQEDPTIFEKAVEKKIVLASPSTFYAVLSTISSLWNLAKKNQNAEIILKDSITLINKLATFVKRVDKLENSIKTVQNNMEELKKPLSGHGGILNMASKFNKLGIKNNIHKEKPEQTANIIEITEVLWEEQNEQL